MQSTTETINLGIVTFKEDDCFFVYCPSLDLIGYGYTEQEANDSFNIVIDEYLKYTTEHGTLIADLEQRGWKIKDNRKKITPPRLSDSLKRNNDLKNIINYNSFNKFDIPVGMPL